MAVLACLDDLNYGRRIHPQMYRPNTFAQWIHDRWISGWVRESLDQSEKREVINHVLKILGVLNFSTVTD